MTRTAKGAAPARVTFYELNEQRDVLDRFLLEQEGEETPEIAALWDALAGDASNKALNWAKWNKERALEGKVIEAMEAALKAQLAALVASRKAIENEVARSRAELSRQMLRFGLEAAKAPGVSIWHVDEAPVVVVPPLDALPVDRLDELCDEGLVAYIPEETVVTPAHHQWSEEKIIQVAAAIEAAIAAGTPRADVAELPAGVAVTFRKGIRIR